MLILIVTLTNYGSNLYNPTATVPSNANVFLHRSEGNVLEREASAMKRMESFEAMFTRDLTLTLTLNPTLNPT